MNLRNNAHLEKFLLVILVILSAVLRLWNLGFSHFYGDETKTLYLDKTVAAYDFFFAQRKAPLQFLVSWVMEKLTGGYDEFWIRLPFAVAGLASVFVLYLIVKNWFGRKAAMFSAFLFSLSGFYIAFSRTAQYQSLYILLGLLAVYFATLRKKHFIFLLLSGITLGAAFLAHYDSLFFIVPVMWEFLSDINRSNYKKSLLDFFTFFVVPCLVILSVFYVPYFFKGYFYDNTLGYLSKRVAGASYAPNNSLYTTKIYNPAFLYFSLFAFSLFAFYKQAGSKVLGLFAWFTSAFVVFEFVFLNPGTHIHNYFLPLIILSGVGFSKLYSHGGIWLRYAVGIAFFVVAAVQFFVFVPGPSVGYPWKFVENSLFLVSSPSKAYHLYLYGFPYNRGWDLVYAYVSTHGGVRGFYTNDNPTVAQYYMRGYLFTPIGTNFIPQTYIEVYNNQEFRYTNPDLLKNYVLEKEFYFEGEKVSSLYRQITMLGSK